MTPTDVLFLHPNFPGQYRHLAAALAQDPAYRVYAIGSHTAAAVPGVELLRYRYTKDVSAEVHPFARQFDIGARRAEQAMYVALMLREKGVRPVVTFVHPGWGEHLALRELFPDTRLIVYCEFFYRSSGADVGFDREFPQLGLDGLVQLRVRNAGTLLGLADADIGIAPTAWQASLFPAVFRQKIHIIHDGIDTDLVRPDPAAEFVLRSGEIVRPGDEVITFLSRSLEPYRGFHVFVRALPAILEARPNARVVIVGKDEVSYGSGPPSGTWRETFLAEVRHRLDMNRITFFSKLPYGTYLRLLQVSRVHVYLTYPFVLSWSAIEAMAAGCLIVGSDTPPVQEVITHGRNGLLVPFFSTEELAATVVEAAAEPDRFASLRVAARQDAVRRYDFRTASLPRLRVLAQL